MYSIRRIATKPYLIIKYYIRAFLSFVCSYSQYRPRRSFLNPLKYI